MQAAAEARAVEVENSRASLVSLSGAQGSYASYINGFWRATAERQEKRVVYVKVGNDSMRIEHFMGQWQLKTVSQKGQNLCTAWVPGGCALEACTSCVWNAASDDGKTLLPQPRVKMLSGADAEREVSGCCLCAHCTAARHPSLQPPRACAHDLVML